jgi:hypothetical protein
MRSARTSISLNSGQAKEEEGRKNAEVRIQKSEVRRRKARLRAEEGGVNYWAKGKVEMGGRWSWSRNRIMPGGRKINYYCNMQILKFRFCPNSRGIG